MKSERLVYVVEFDSGPEGWRPTRVTTLTRSEANSAAREMRSGELKKLKFRVTPYVPLELPAEAQQPTKRGKR